MIFKGFTPKLALQGANMGQNISNITNNTTSPIINFNQEIQTPDIVSRNIHKIFTYGLAGK